MGVSPSYSTRKAVQTAWSWPVAAAPILQRSRARVHPEMSHWFASAGRSAVTCADNDLPERVAVPKAK